jgi:hypothetical protein
VIGFTVKAHNVSQRKGRREASFVVLSPMRLNRISSSVTARPSAPFCLSCRVRSAVRGSRLVHHGILLRVCGDVICAQPSCVTTLATLESRINNYPAASSRVLNTLTKGVRSKLLAMNLRAIQISPSPPEPRCGPFQIDFLFQVGRLAGRSWPAGATGANESIPSPHHRSKTTLK